MSDESDERRKLEELSRQNAKKRKVRIVLHESRRQHERDVRQRHAEDERQRGPS